MVRSDQPRFSLLVANYGNGCYLDAAIDSVVRQSYENWELIIVDDASIDDSIEVISRWSIEPRIRLIRHPVNRGVGAAFATAAAAASGEIFGMLGADDALRSDALERMVKAHLSHPDASLINSDLVSCDTDLVPLAGRTEYGPLPKGDTLIRNCPISSFATFKRSAYVRTSGFDPAFSRAVDHDLYLKLEEVGALSYVAKGLYFYRQHSGGISQGANGLLAAQFSLMARANAYHRRLGTTIPNLTRQEYRTVMSTYHSRQGILVAKASRIQSLRHWIRAATFRPRIILTRGFWGNTLRQLLPGSSSINVSDVKEY